MIASGYYGPEIWQTPISLLANLPPALSFLGSYTFRDFWVWILLSSFFIAHLPSCVANVVAARRARNEPLAPAFREWTPMLVYVAACCAWLGSPHSALLPRNHLVLFCLTQSLVFGRMTTKVILAHLTRQPFPYWTVLIVPLVGGAVLTNLPRLGLPGPSPRQELAYMWAYLAFAIVVYARWALLVITSICNYLGIQCLTIPVERQRELAKGKLKA